MSCEAAAKWMARHNTEVLGVIVILAEAVDAVPAAVSHLVMQQ